MRKYPLDRLAAYMVLGFCLGIFLAGRQDQGASNWEFIGVFLALGLLAWCLSRKRKRMLCIGLAVCLGFGLFYYAQEPNRSCVVFCGEEHTYTGEVLSATAGKNWLHLDIHAVDGNFLDKPIRVRVLKAYGDEVDYTKWSQVAFKGKLDKPDQARNPGGFDLRKFLFAKGISFTLVTDQVGQLIQPAQGLGARLNGLSAKIDQVIEQHFAPEEEAILKAVLFGDTSQLHDDFYSYTQKTGIFHIFSVSGLHVGFIVAFIMFLAKVFHAQQSWWVFLCMLPLLTLYVLLSDMSPPAVRAGLMAVVGVLAMRLLRYRDGVTILALAAAILLSASPHLLWDIGFQLSFLITLGILLGYDALKEMIPPLPIKGLREGISLSLAAELTSIPLIAWYFYVFAPFSLGMNLLIVPLFSLLVPLTLIGIIVTCMVPFLGSLAFLPSQILLYATGALIRLSESFLGSGHVYVGKPPLELLGLYFLILALFFQRESLLKGHLQSSKGLLLVLLFLLGMAPQTLPKNQVLAVLDVGQGSSALVQTAEGDFLAFDTGPSKDTLANYLRYGGINQLKALVLSHGDEDHITGLRFVLRDMKLEHLFIPEDVLTRDAWPGIKDLCARKKTQIHVVKNTETILFDEKTYMTLLPLQEAREDGNGSQLLAQVSLDGRRIVFPGDGSREMLEQVTWPQKAQVVLVPHHGSKHSWSEAFYEGLDPDLALISAGRGNRYRHPHLEVLERLKQRQIPIQQTKEDGAILLYEEQGAWIIKTPCREVYVEE